MDVRERIMTWDDALRRGDWDQARAWTADDATFGGSDGPRCASADGIVALMRSWKGTVPDVEILQLDVHADHAVAHLRQPAWGPKAVWYRVLTVRDDRIVSLMDYDSLD